MNKAYNVAKHDIYFGIKIVSLDEMYVSHRCFSADSGFGNEIVSSDTIQLQSLTTCNLCSTDYLVCSAYSFHQRLRIVEWVYVFIIYWRMRNVSDRIAVHCCGTLKNIN